MNFRRVIVVTIVLVALAFPGTISAQTVGMSLNQNGTLFRLQGSLPLDGPLGAWIHTNYVIAGVLDLGLAAGLAYDASEDLLRSDIGLSYAVAAVKQGDVAPFSLQVYGTYTFQQEDSDFLTRNRLIREAQGYNLGVTLVRDLYYTESFAFRLGAMGEYQSLREATTVGFDATGFTGSADVDYAEYPQERLRTGFSYGGHVGLLWLFPEGGAMLVGSAILTSAAFDLTIRPDVQIQLGR
ncbi:MAG: hypothetical protein ACOC0O_01470 [Spirochaetota bacterium]